MVDRHVNVAAVTGQPADSRRGSGLKRYRVYFAQSRPAPPEEIELLSPSHADALQSAANMIGSYWAVEVWHGSSCIGGVTHLESRTSKVGYAEQA